MKPETYLTKGCGYGKSKERTLQAFWTTLWPVLVGQGWKQISDFSGTNGQIVILLVPPGIDISKSVKGVDYYDRLLAVINRIMERRNPAESNAADEYGKAIKAFVDNADSKKSDKSSRIRREVQALTIESPLRWKEDRRFYPKASSRVGPEYQVESIPQCLPPSYTMNMKSKVVMYDQIWDPAKATASGHLNYIQNNVPYKKRGIGMILLHELQYNINDHFLDTLDKVNNPNDYSSWSQQEKDLFHRYIYQNKKDISKVAKLMKKSFNSCYYYYLTKYKKTSDYIVLKIIYQQEKKEKDDDCCAVCRDGGDLIICEGCEASYHLSCLNPPLLEVPECDWYCDECNHRKLLQLRKLLFDGTSFRTAWEYGEKLQTNNTTQAINGGPSNEKPSATTTGTKISSLESTITKISPQMQETRDSSKASLDMPTVVPQVAIQNFVNSFAAILNGNRDFARTNQR